MTEIPEHLLKRSKERRSAIGGGDAPAEGDPPPGEAVEAAPAAAPAVPVAAAVEVAVPAPPPPVRPEVAAALRRKKIPIWAMPVLAGLPLWAYVYQATLEPPPAGESDPIVLGEEIFGSCASCHGADGSGGVGPALDNVVEQWPDYRDHLMWVRIGNTGWYAAKGERTYGATDTPSNGATMPDFGPTLSEPELAQVVLYERVTFGGMEQSGAEYDALVAIAEGTSTFKDAGLGDLSTAAGVDESNLAAG